MDLVSGADKSLDQPEQAGNDAFRSAAVDASGCEDRDLHRFAGSIAIAA
jgi:hypothetical protein